MSSKLFGGIPFARYVCVCVCFCLWIWGKKVNKIHIELFTCHVSQNMSHYTNKVFDKFWEYLCVSVCEYVVFIFKRTNRL